MPTYEYQCKTCHKQVEHFLKIADRDNPGPCECGGTLRKLIKTLPTVMIDGTDPEFPSAAGKWDADRLRTIKREQKNLKDTGDYYKNNRHW